MTLPSFDTEAEFEQFVADYFQRFGHTVHRQPWFNVRNDGGTNDGAHRRGDLHVQLAHPLGGWLRTLALELKLDRWDTGNTNSGDIRGGIKQTIAYMGAFDWRTERARTSRNRLPRPDVALFTTPSLWEGNYDEDEWAYYRYDLLDHGAALLVGHEGAEPGVGFHLHRLLALTGQLGEE